MTIRDEETTLGCAPVNAELAVLKNVVSRIDNSIAAMTEVSTSIGKLLAVHEERLNQLEKDNTTVGLDIRDIHSRITTMSREIVDKLEATEKTLELKIKESNDATGRKLESMSKEMKSIDDRVGFLERWKWMVLGGALAMGWVIAKMPSGFNLL